MQVWTHWLAAGASAAFNPFLARTKIMSTFKMFECLGIDWLKRVALRSLACVAWSHCYEAGVASSMQRACSNASPLQSELCTATEGGRASAGREQVPSEQIAEGPASVQGCWLGQSVLTHTLYTSVVVGDLYGTTHYTCCVFTYCVALVCIQSHYTSSMLLQLWPMGRCEGRGVNTCYSLSVCVFPHLVFCCGDMHSPVLWTTNSQTSPTAVGKKFYLLKPHMQTVWRIIFMIHVFDKTLSG